jgi:hypothetical protein
VRGNRKWQKKGRKLSCNTDGFVVGESAGDAAVAVAEKVVGVLPVAAIRVQTGG